jgi:phospholipid/cholesterol/gamma-HCH transport system substrate-binding protein
MHYTHRLSQARIHQIVGWFVLVPVLILGVVLFVIGKKENLFEEKYDVTTVFSEGFGLRVGYPVMLLGIEVGRIKKIEFTEQNNTAFTLTILKKYQDKIRMDSVAKVGKSGGFFGEPQIEITPGNKSQPIVADGGHIEAEEPTDIADLLAEAKPVLESVKRTLARVEQITEDVQAVVKTGQATLTEVQGASTRLPGVMDNIRETTATVRQTARNVADDVPGVIASARKSMDRVGDVVEDVKTSTAKLPAVIENARAATEDLKGLMHEDVPAIVRSAQGSMEDVNEILVGAKKTFPISVFANKGKAARSDGVDTAPGLRSLRKDELTKE